MNGISAKVSSRLIHLDLLRVISHASGIPAIRSRAETIKPIMNEFRMEVKAVFIKAGWLMTSWIMGAFIRMPRIGGIRIMARKTEIAER